MFTGIIQRLGYIEQIGRQGMTGRIAIMPHHPFSRTIRLGDSVAVNGACLTVVDMDGKKLIFDVLRETFEKTNLGEKASNDAVNLEQALTLGEPFGGHILTGHVDGIGVVEKIERIDRELCITINCSYNMLIPMVSKGSIAVNGISLTVVELTEYGFTVHIAPHTLQETDISEFTVGARVNIETDLFGKYVQRILACGDKVKPL